MRRRGFFGVLTGAVAALFAPAPKPHPGVITAAELPDEWGDDDWGEHDIDGGDTPGPPNRIVTPEWVAKQVGEHLRYNLTMSQHINRAYDESFAQDCRVVVRLPERYRR